MIEFQRDPEKKMPVTWTVDYLPGNEFGMCFPENFTARDTEAFLAGWTTEMAWRFSENLAEGAAADERGELDIRIFEQPDEHAVCWDMCYRNTSTHDLAEVASFNCLSLSGAPLFRDLPMERTRVRAGAGNWVDLRNVAKTAGRRTIQFYPAAGGIALEAHPWVQRFEITSEQVLAGDRIVVDSTDGEWRLENVVESPVAFFFNNWEPHAGCVHVAPLYGSVRSGETVTVRGKIRFLRPTS